MISTSGFGHALPWADNETASAGKMPLKEALITIANNHLLYIALPKWAFSLPLKKYDVPSLRAVRPTDTLFRFQDLNLALKTAMEFMQNMIRTRRQEFASGASQQCDILSLMIQSAEEEGSKFKMTDEELVSAVSS